MVSGGGLSISGGGLKFAPPTMILIAIQGFTSCGGGLTPILIK